ncbi:MAG: bifunctional precorrin-2 dehydrogenase/sirohydrochlorin ferrochelatase [Candidatus Methanoperedens sp.]|nr:bifunctional precorrin-2 dehydrogenase/sirohydrochlorin ferrochelatase [Candidatus Methanoperedens sp.]MCE8427555.1 bifunctional precorrin-2 dehydrogenase/sirohydrochlorin ferrochelatase [Candidatus Methanoperedens sp.]
MKDFVPLLLNLQEKKVVIFGGGEVGERKALFFCDYAKVTVVSKEFTGKLSELQIKKIIQLIKVNELTETDISRHLKDAFIVIPATNDMILNEKIAGIAENSGQLVNRVDDLGDVIVPSIIRRGDIVIGISTLGQSPALSKYIRKNIEGVITPGLAVMTRLQNEIREMLKSRVGDQKERKEILWNIMNDSEVWEAINESYEKAYKVASKHIGKKNE